MELWSLCCPGNLPMSQKARCFLPLTHPVSTVTAPNLFNGSNVPNRPAGSCLREDPLLKMAQSFCAAILPTGSGTHTGVLLALKKQSWDPKRVLFLPQVAGTWGKKTENNLPLWNVITRILLILNNDNRNGLPDTGLRFDVIYQKMSTTTLDLFFTLYPIF